jgi:hypothetical protein
LASISSGGVSRRTIRVREAPSDLLDDDEYDYDAPVDTLQHAAWALPPPQEEEVEIPVE